MKELFERPSLLLKPRVEQIPPVRIEMRGSGSSVRCKVNTTNLFGLYRMEDIEECTKQKYTEYPDAWVLLDTVVTETLTFGASAKLRNVTGKRTLSIRSPEPAPLLADEVLELFRQENEGGRGGRGRGGRGRRRGGGGRGTNCSDAF
jgi:hypothetical protein